MSTSRTVERSEPRGRRGAAGFVGHWQMWMLAIPAVGTLGFLISGGWRVRIAGRFVIPIGMFNAHAGAEIVWLVATASTALALFVIGAGMVRKRVTFVVVHLSLSTWLAGILVSVTTTIGWPLWWAIAHVVLSGSAAISWNFYRGDALRGDPREKSDEDGALGKLFGIPRTKIGNPRIGEFAVRASVKPGMGETLDDIEKAIPKIEEAAEYAIPGRTRVERNPDTGRAELVIQHADPLKTWPRWSGPSHPGGSFAEGGAQGLYEDGEVERVFLAARTDADGTPLPAGHYGTMGMARSGKSGCAAVRWTDMVFTRRDVVLAYCDCASPEQSMASQVMADLVMYADHPAKVKALFIALMNLSRSRGERMIRYGFRDWSAAVYEHPRLRIPGLVIAVDEADKVIGHKWFTDVATTVLKAGIFLDVILPRADGDSMPTTGRFSFGQWSCFGTGDEYSHTFVIPDNIATARPDLWGNTKPGYHYTVRVPGVDERRWAMVARSFRAELPELQSAARAGRAYRAVLPPEDIAALGRAWTVCRPLSPGATGPIDPDAWAYDKPPTSANTTQTEGRNVDDDEDRYADDEERIPPPTMRAEDAESGDAEDYAATDPRQPIPPHHGPNDSFEDPADQRPRPPSKDAAREAFDLTLRQMARDGTETFTNADVIDKYPYRMADSTMSERMSQVCEGEYVQPPGLTIERLGRGRYRLVRDAASVLVGDTV